MNLICAWVDSALAIVFSYYKSGLQIRFVYGAKEEKEEEGRRRKTKRRRRKKRKRKGSANLICEPDLRKGL